VCMVFACVPEVLYLLFGIDTKRSTSRKLKSFVPSPAIVQEKGAGSDVLYVPSHESWKS